MLLLNKKHKLPFILLPFVFFKSGLNTLNVPHQRKQKVVEWNYFTVFYFINKGCENNKVSEELV